MAHKLTSTDGKELYLFELHYNNDGTGSIGQNGTVNINYIGTTLRSFYVSYSTGSEFTVDFEGGYHIRFYAIQATGDVVYQFYRIVDGETLGGWSGTFSTLEDGGIKLPSIGIFIDTSRPFDGSDTFACGQAAYKIGNDSHTWSGGIAACNPTSISPTLVNVSLWPLGDQSRIFYDVVDDSDPLSPGGTSVTGGGGGTFDRTSDAIDFPGLPSLSAVTAGFITIYAPTIPQLRALSAYMWSDAFSLESFKKLFADPMEAIIGLSIVPVSVPTSGMSTVKVGGFDTGVSMNKASSQYMTVDCGSLQIAEYWGSALDWSPYSRFSIYLPYIGTRELKPDDIMRKELHVVYNIDILSGSLTAMIKCGSSVLYEFSGSCACTIPVTGSSWAQFITSAIQLAGAGVAVAASGGSAAGLLPSTANSVMAMKPNISRSGTVSGPAGLLGVQQPYLIWESPNQSLAQGYNKFVGYPSNITAKLSDLTGMTVIESIHLENLSATDAEKTEIETLLKGGVFL